MEPTQNEVEEMYRIRLILGKFRVIKMEKGAVGFRAWIDLGNSVNMVIDCPFSADLRLYDNLTFYTEVPYADPATTPLNKPN